MIACKNIVVTTDLSANSGVALPYAAALAKLDNGTIHLFHAFEDEAGEALSAGVMVGTASWVSVIRKKREEQLAQAAQQAEKDLGVKVIHAASVGHPAKEAAKYAERVNADITVVATHGRTGLAHLLLGSVAERIVRLSSTPVLTVRPGEKPPLPGFKFSTILLPTDFSVNSTAVRRWAIELARSSRARIVLAHVVEDSVYYASAAASEGVGADIEQWIATVWADTEKQLAAEAANLARESGVVVKPVMGRGRAVEKIGEIAKSENADIMCISTHGYTGLSHLVFGSVAEHLVRSSMIPVLSIKPVKIESR